MYTKLDNNLILTGFNKAKYVTLEGTYRLIIFKGDITGMTRPIFNENKTISVTVAEEDDTLTATILNTGKGFITSKDDMQHKLERELSHLLLQGNYYEVLIYLNTKEVNPKFFNSLRNYAISNNIRFYVQVSQNAGYEYSADLCCHYDSNRNLVVTKNRLGPTDHYRYSAGDIVAPKVNFNVVKRSGVNNSDKTAVLYNKVTDYIKQNPTSLCFVFGVVFISNEINVMADRLYKDFVDFCSSSPSRVCQLITCEKLYSVLEILGLERGSVIAIDNITNFMKADAVDDFVQALSKLGYHVVYTIDKTVEVLPEEVSDTDKLPTKRTDDLFMNKYYEVKNGMKIELTLKQTFPKFNHMLIGEDTDAKMVGVAGLDIYCLQHTLKGDIETIRLNTTMRQFELIGKQYHRKIFTDNVLGMNNIVEEEIGLFPWGRGRSYIIEREAQVYGRSPIVDYLKVLREISIEHNVRLYIKTTLAEVLRGASDYLDILIYFNPKGEMSVPYNKVGYIDDDSLTERLRGTMLSEEPMKLSPLDFNIISPNDHHISINYMGTTSTINCTSEQETRSLSDEVTRTIEKIEEASNRSVLVDVRVGRDEDGRSISYELRQNLDNSFVILKETYLFPKWERGSAKINLPIGDGTMTAAEAIAKWVTIK